MTITLPLDQMTAAEKLSLMQDIWEDLDKRSEEVESPSWHEQVLLEREKRIAAGEETFHDWDVVKAELLAERKSELGSQNLRQVPYDG